ncbi:hypothetical protein C0995_002696 [Termitomyces sp. Mi166|nr:hypothetical protein C0995_002696 [Termitomyces sp. Mi166\
MIHKDPHETINILTKRCCYGYLVISEYTPGTPIWTPPDKLVSSTKSHFIEKLPNVEKPIPEKPRLLADPMYIDGTTDTDHKMKKLYVKCLVPNNQ